LICLVINPLQQDQLDTVNIGDRLQPTPFGMPYEGIGGGKIISGLFWRRQTIKRSGNPVQGI